MRLFALPALALVIVGLGASKPAGESAIAHSAKITLNSGSARFVVSYSDFNESESGAIDLGDETAVLDRGDIFGPHSLYQPIHRREALVLGIPNKRWVETPTDGGYSLVADPFVIGTRSFFKLLARGSSVKALGPGEERGASVDRYAARLLLEDFLAELPPFERETSKAGDDAWPTSWRDWLYNYHVGEFGGQRAELAVDSQGRIRHAHVELYDAVTVELYDYGVPVDVSPPPADQVISSSEYERLKSEYCSVPSRQTQPREAPCQ